MTMLQMGDADKEYNKFILKTPNQKIDQLFLIVVKYKPKNLFKDCLESVQVFFSKGYYQCFKSIPQNHKTYLFR